MESNVDTSPSWRAEEAIAGSGRALDALRELIINPFLYSRESRKIGLKVMAFQFFFYIIISIVVFSFCDLSLFLIVFNFSWLLECLI